MLRRMTPRQRLHDDHADPHSCGGGEERENVRIVSVSTYRRRSDRASTPRGNMQPIPSHAERIASVAQKGKTSWSRKR